MTQKLIYTLLALLFSTCLVSAQFIVQETQFSPTGVSDQGKVAGYLAQSGPWSIWLREREMYLDLEAKSRLILFLF